eukprot:CAMPEP_0197644258 /NCGR_PEP_ID=MMETSP1338-20131121/17294_1 /TAXON_ID=43686 ORGANISM="Pelagodinium beii, Strain RCC1491" /NCGR_SAMPLE_ID=MMETSP1338 /ASSEMBLY_ACC=CAM_ASM_000754 /LENGTH=131 /DNA_ID=CAMNT_0043217623 /DNA_START=73 /DNA_END=469 /DNA_ORIENTATION=+
MAIVRVLLAVLSAALAEESCEETAMLQQMKDIHEHKEQDSKFGPSTCTSEDKSCCMSLPKCSSNAMANKMCPGDIGSALTYDCVGSNMFDMMALAFASADLVRHALQTAFAKQGEQLLCRDSFAQRCKLIL